MKKKHKQYINQLAQQFRGKDIMPHCPHFGQCGGCLFQDISYEDQLVLKKQLVNDTLQGIASVERVFPSTPYRYRSRMDMVTAFGKYGLRRAGSFRVVVDIESCSIMQEKSDALFRKIRPFVMEIEGYDYLRHQGYLRYVVLRESLFTGQVMVNFVVSARENRLEALIASIAGDVDSISLIHTDRLADISYGDILETIKVGFIEEIFDGIRYRITPNSFFQSNSAIALQMYRRIKEEARGSVLDLCSGVGSISLFLADHVDHVTGIELSTEAVETAEMNKAINSIENVEFIAVDAKNFLRDHSKEYRTIVLDPPRSGMHRSAVEILDQMKAEKIIYMSCNPLTFRNDISLLKNYRIESLEAYDMFPQTPHIELLAMLKMT